MNEIDALIAKARESLSAAQSLIREGHPDFASGRAYYAMFYVAEALLALLDQSYSKHSAVISAFGREYAKKGVLDSKFHQRLIAAQNFRNIGDYGIDAHVSEEEAESVCLWADEMIQAAFAYLAEKRGTDKD